MTVHSIRDRALLVIPIRIALGLVWLAAAPLAGAGRGPAMFAFVIGLLGILIAIFQDPRRRFARSEPEPLELPPDAVVAPAWRQALAATLPSTVGVSVLAAIAVVPQPTLAALLGGVCAGLGVATLLSLSRIDATLYVDPRSRVFYRR
jgi:hypothetical protein